MNKKTSWRSTILVAVLLCVGVSAQAPEHVHRTKDLRHYAVRILEVEKAQIVAVDLEENPEAVVSVLRFEVDKNFRFAELRENKSGDGVFELRGLGGMKGASGVLTYCSVCRKCIGMRIGKVDLYK